MRMYTLIAIVTLLKLVEIGGRAVVASEPPMEGQALVRIPIRPLELDCSL
jgi:hypothetical protein